MRRVNEDFRESYEQARALLLQRARQRGLTVFSHRLPLRGRDGEELAMDVVRDGPAQARRVLLTTSGVHGVEGFCGSAIQSALLAGASLTAGRADLAVLHVHAVNPHGFSFARRVNEDNVDLNRNFVDFSRPLPDNADYRQLHPWLLPQSWPPPPESEAALQAQLAEWPARRGQLAITGGQHAHADGLFFGGGAPTWSQRVFRQVLRQHVAHARHVAWIDLHTGLGPWGVGERIFAAHDTGLPLERARSWWGAAVTSVHTGSSTSIPMTGPIQMAIYDECPNVDYSGICLEFGTVPAPDMHRALRADHWLHRATRVSPDQAHVIRDTLREAFYPRDPAWREQVRAQGIQAAEQAAAGLAALPPD